MHLKNQEGKKEPSTSATVGHSETDQICFTYGTAIRYPGSPVVVVFFKPAFFFLNKNFSSSLPLPLKVFSNNLIKL